MVVNQIILMTTQEKCKFCKRKGTISFGLLIDNSVWINKHFTCDNHSAISVAQQQHDRAMYELKSRMKLPLLPALYSRT